MKRAFVAWLMGLCLCGSMAVSAAVGVAPGASANKVVMTGVASYYANKFHGKRTASGALFDKNALTAAHLTLPFGTKVKVVNLHNKRSVVVTINDRGAFGKHGRVIDVSGAAASQLGMKRRGMAKVRLEVLK